MKAALGKSSTMEIYYQTLVKDGLFDTMKDVMLTAIALGYKNNRRASFDKYGGDAIKEHIFKDDMDFLNVIAVLTTKDIKILLEENKDEKYKMLEEYAEGGMQILVDSIFNETYTDADKIISYVKSQAPAISGEKQDLSDLFGGIIDELENS